MKIYYCNKEFQPSQACLITGEFIMVDRQDLEKGVLDTVDALCIAATDETARLAQKQNLAVLGYCNPDIPGQMFSGVPMLVEGFEEVDDNFILQVYQRKHHIPWTILETERCVLRELCMDDLGQLFDLYAAPGVTDYLEPLYEWDKEYEYQQAYIMHMYGYYGYGMWLVFEKTTGKLIGRAGLEHREYQGQVELELGYLIHPDYQHQHYATEVCEAVLAYASDNLSFDTVNCLIEPENASSIALAQKLGFYLKEECVMDEKKMMRFEKKLHE